MFYLMLSFSNQKSMSIETPNYDVAWELSQAITRPLNGANAEPWLTAPTATGGIGVFRREEVVAFEIVEEETDDEAARAGVERVLANLPGSKYTRGK